MNEIRGFDKAQREYEDRLPEDLSRHKRSKFLKKHFDDECVDWDSLRDELDDRNRY